MFEDYFCFVCYCFNLKSPRFCIFKATFVLPGYSFVFVKITFVLIFCNSQGNFWFCLAMCETDGGSQRSLASALKQHWNSFNILQGSFCFAWYWLCVLKTHFLLFVNFQTRFALLLILQRSIHNIETASTIQHPDLFILSISASSCWRYTFFCSQQILLQCINGSIILHKTFFVAQPYMGPISVSSCYISFKIDEDFCKSLKIFQKRQEEGRIRFDTSQIL